MNLSVHNMCFACSGIGEHDIWSRIPIYVHANPKEFRYWPKSIAEMIKDICGVLVSTNINLFLRLPAKDGPKMKNGFICLNNHDRLLPTPHALLSRVAHAISAFENSRS